MFLIFLTCAKAHRKLCRDVGVDLERRLVPETIAHLQLHFWASRKDACTLSQLLITDTMTAPVIKLYSRLQSAAAGTCADEFRNRVHAQIVKSLSMKCDCCATGAGECVYRRAITCYDNVLAIVVLPGQSKISDTYVEILVCIYLNIIYICMYICMYICVYI